MAVLNNPKISLSSLIENRDRKNWIEPVKKEEVKIEEDNSESTPTNKISLLSMKKNHPLETTVPKTVEPKVITETSTEVINTKPKVWISFKEKVAEKDESINFQEIPKSEQIVDTSSIKITKPKEEPVEGSKELEKQVSSNSDEILKTEELKAAEIVQTEVEEKVLQEEKTEKLENEQVTLIDEKKVEETTTEQIPVVNVETKNILPLQEEKTDPVIIWWKVLAKDPDWLFMNYKSEFENKENAVLAQIKKLKNLPKTRPLFVASLIWLLVFGLLGLYLINPEKNNLKYYKASIVWNVKSVVWESGTSESTSTWIVNNSNSWASVQTIPEKVEVKEERKKEEIMKWGYKISFESKVDASWKKTYRYKWEEFFDMISLNKKFSEWLDQSKEDKVRNYLLNKWK